MEKNNTNSNEIFEILLRDSLSEKIEQESEELSKSAVEHNFETEFSKDVDRIARGINSEERKKIAYKVTFRSLTSIACALGIVFCLLLTQPTVYAAVADVVRQVFGEYDEYSFVEPDEEIAFNTEIRPQYIPEGFTLRMIYYGDVNISITYETIDGQQLYFDYGLATEGTAIFIDNENSIYSPFMKDGREYHYYETTNEYGYNVLMWAEKGYVYELSSQLEKDVLVKIAENIK